MKFEGKITGVQLFESSVQSTLRFTGHLEDVGCRITIEICREKAKGLAQQYGLEEKTVPIYIGPGE